MTFEKLLQSLSIRFFEINRVMRGYSELREYAYPREAWDGMRIRDSKVQTYFIHMKEETETTGCGPGGNCQSTPQEVRMNPQELDRLVAMSDNGAVLGAYIPPMEQHVMLLETRILVRGKNVATATKSELIDMIKSLKAEKEALVAVGVESTYVAKQIDDINKAVEVVVAALDA